MQIPSTDGLSAADAAHRLARDGHNDLPVDAPRSLLRLVLEVLSEPMFALLLAAAVIYALIGDHIEALVLCVFATVSVLITVVQQGRSQRVLDALRDLSSPRALVLRDGQPLRIPGREVVTGDVLLFTEGDRVAADGVLLSGSAVEADESLLTGESLPVTKQVDAPGQGGSLLYSGTLVVKGHGRARVTATGARSEIGKIGLALRRTALAIPRLQAETTRLVRIMAVFGLVVSLLVVAIQGLLHDQWLEGVLGGIAVGMSMLPEEFPLVLTVFMVMGAWRLSSSRVLTRRASAIETLGAATVLCTDKTGTLTHNRISVVRLSTGARAWNKAEGETVLAQHPTLGDLLRVAQRASDPATYDPIDVALLALPGATDDGAWEIVQDYPLQPGLPMVGRAWRDPASGQGLLAVKGAPETVLSACGLDEAQRVQILAEVAALAQEGMRVLAVAQALTAVSLPVATLSAAGLRYAGLVAFADPLRDSVPEAVRQCRSAGLRVLMITGDHPHTARAMARQAGLVEGEVLVGTEIDALSSAEFARQVVRASIFARITPGQKLRIVEALKAAGEVVAMTGDGVNDAPALKAADIGIAMGKRGSDVAREAAALVLLDDDFGSIVRAVRIGRRIYDNLRKTMVYILAVHVPIAGIALLPLLLGQPMLLTPMIVALLEIIIDPACSVVLEAEPEEEDVMARPPRDPTARLLSLPVAVWSLIQGGLALVMVLAVLWLARVPGMSEAHLRGVALPALVGVNLVLIFVNRSLAASSLRTLLRANPSFWIILGLVVTLNIGVLYWTPLRRFMNLESPSLHELALCGVATALLLVLLQGLRAFRSPSAWR
jgi:Ca2+-transporting ATPase